MTTVTIPVSAIDQMIASLETFKMALMVAKSGGDVSQVAAMASMTLMQLALLLRSLLRLRRQRGE